MKNSPSTTTYKTTKIATVERVSASKATKHAKTPKTAPTALLVAKRAPAASIEIIGDTDTVLFDGFAPLALVKQFRALIDLHNAA